MSQVSPLVERKEEGFDSLIKEYSNSDKRHQNHCELISYKFSSWRRIRGDGNCLYTCFLFGFLETLLKVNPTSEYPLILELLLSHNVNFIRNSLLQVEFDVEITDGFFEAFEELVRKIFTSHNDCTSATAILESVLNEEPTSSNSIIAYLRLVSSAWIRLNSTIVLPYIISNNIGELSENPTTLIKNYCSKIVEPMDQSSDDISLLALVKSFSIPSFFSIVCIIISMDTCESYLPEFKYSNGDDFSPPLSITLLYRPGHYDLLYTM